MAKQPGRVLRFKLVRPGAQRPSYESPGAAGMDVRACLEGPELRLPPHVPVLVPTGLVPEVPEGFELQVRPRSSLPMKRLILVANSPGTIDSDYRGEIMVMLLNANDFFVSVQNGERIAQLVFAPVVRAIPREAAEVSETERGEGGFGSTGSE